MKLSKEDFLVLKNHIITCGRDIDVSMFEYIFNNGSLNNCLTNLEIYQNRDGGVGKGIGFSLTPQSTTLQCIWGLSYLYSLNTVPSARESRLLHKVCSFLYHRRYKSFLSEIEEDEDKKYPHFFVPEDQINFSKICCAAFFLGYALYFLEKDDKYYKIAVNAAPKIIWFLAKVQTINVLEYSSICFLYDVLESKQLFTPQLSIIENYLQKLYNPDFLTLKGKDLTLVHYVFYTCKHFKNEEMIQENIDYLLSLRNENKLFNFLFIWTEEYQYEIQKRKWSAHFTLLILNALKRYGGISNE
jgi:hypothetical protein